MEPELIATVMESGYEDEVFFCEINGMSESMFKQVEYNARCNAIDGIDDWPEEADFAKVRLHNFEWFEGQPSGIEGIPQWEIAPQYEMDVEVIEFSKVVPDGDGKPIQVVLEN